MKAIEEYFAHVRQLIQGLPESFPERYEEQILLADFSKSLGRFKMLDLLAIIIGVGILAIFGYGIWKLVSEMP